MSSPIGERTSLGSRNPKVVVERRCGMSKNNSRHICQIGPLMQVIKGLFFSTIFPKAEPMAEVAKRQCS
jgi:hypothetical protein